MTTTTTSASLAGDGAGGGGRGSSAPTVAGLTRMSACDWPGHLTATVFLQGCPWACTYCHNPDLIDPRAPGILGWEEVLAFLRRRRGLLDGVVFSGGEPTRSPALPGAVQDARDLGFGVGLHTGGAFPNRLDALLGRVDWVGLDIKAMPEDYPAVVGRPGSGQRAWLSLDLVLASGVDHEIRTTIHPGSPAAERLVELATRLRSAGVRAFAVQQARARGARAGFRADAPGWDATVLRLGEEVRALGFERFALRRAA